METKKTFSHITNTGQAKMVDVGNKEPTNRTARAEAFVTLSEKILIALREQGGVAKGNVIKTARIAGIMAAKKTSELIPMCHPLPLHYVSIDITETETGLHIETSVKTYGITGVEMEALTAASITALTIYDMCKSADKGLIIKNIRLLQKTGGKSGDWRALNE